MYILSTFLNFLKMSICGIFGHFTKINIFITLYFTNSMQLDISRVFIKSTIVKVFLKVHISSTFLNFVKISICGNFGHFIKINIFFLHYILQIRCKWTFVCFHQTNHYKDNKKCTYGQIS